MRFYLAIRRECKYMTNSCDRIIQTNYVIATILDQNPWVTLEEVRNLLKEIGWYEKTYK
ncbi:hypothetical protein KQH90_10520 [Anaerosalibacter bizertensis]|uniref:hypothetical protein n=1 Tax=Anaerosalibacter bizertensis TaxID=932217 RepID=UPI001C0EF6E6|nr:hypothetical protein [Anaerosalibacter bizertensis]MBU5294463.1 hypothetical protein [Anaerosalibacter bizertensis]